MQTTGICVTLLVSLLLILQSDSHKQPVCDHLVFIHFIFFCRTRNHQSFPARRLWHFLVKQEVLQETLIRYIFTKKRKQSEVGTWHLIFVFSLEEVYNFFYEF